MAQPSSFPNDWIGHWEGELLWYQGAAKEPRKVNMELQIRPTDSAHKFSWQLSYGAKAEDNRPYTLIAIDTVKGHWMIDENNGIVLNKFWIANKFCGAFTVQHSTIIDNFWIENGKLVVEFYSISAKPIATTGGGNNEIPFVDSYKVNSYQRAILSRE